MNKTYPINISGIVFYINEDAYSLLENYLNTIKQYYLKTEDGAEIISDIESRIAELFSEKVSSSKQVITKQEVEEIIQKLGRPEDFDENTESGEPESRKYSSSKPNKKFYRDTDDGILAGVASGLSHYFGIDVIFIRILFIMLIIGGTIGFWVYIILWIVSPEAKSAVEKLEMKGESINLSNLEKKVREEFENVKASFKDKNASQKLNTFVGKVVSLLSQIVLAIFSLLKSIFGFTFLLIGVTLLSVIASFFIFDSTIISITNEHWVSLPIQDVLLHFADEKQSLVLLLSLAGIIIIPVISLIYSGIKLLFGYKTKNKSFGIISFILLLFSAIIFALSIGDLVSEFKVRKAISKTIDTEAQKQMFLKVTDNSLLLDSDKITFSDHDNEVIITSDRIFLKAENEIHESNDSLFHIKVRKASNGTNKQEAKQYLDNINYNVKIKNDTVYLDYYLIIDERFRGQEVEIQIFKPKGSTILTNMEDFMDDSDYEDIEF